MENITGILKNTVLLYNRGGVKIFEAKGYANVEKYDQQVLIYNLRFNPYFYVIDLGDNRKPITGWMDLNTNQKTWFTTLS
ncbi:hypothetical protein CNR22_22295 [Sphingobacteriaceae bacterium]|nr:hypothetical protein CNR22_22295 [Sphingobacteriaceae bacterium]